MKYFQQQHNAFPMEYLNNLWGEIQACSYFAINNLNRDFVATKGFSLVFRRSHISTVEQKFPYFKPYLDLALQPSCNAFYLNPLQLQQGSRVDPHIDRSLRSYCKTIEPPMFVSVLYVRLPEDMVGGELVLKSHKRQLGQIKPQVNTLLYFQGDLTHSVNAVQTPGSRLSLVCEQYSLSQSELAEIPDFTIESRATKSSTKKRK
ncbi:2OG-Fe(II) oxygenase [Anabaenopsis tanganyikae CS-531]|uniref:2OG-Fe(II) oxygenase n=2 Tax=Anabaenopsis TaxID=110103 RepID=A0ABT5AWI1_9CYAN|nr:MULTISPECIES: 2OG-Fe(II) oxygenase [Anabaenopsis]MDB9541269.1 2OG-Fe(II) oxygenase [Anabaenopsis arnoldii]MDH6093709.1 2OG-Fe(II) oxygenase [Anabaenopsis arnoldii]MDH6104415.1 2OG-Fe(II) oxygenase [Anabaenopsis tanganyikae CS-531]